MLIAQAQVENLIVVTHDKIFSDYGVNILRT
jgi:PIN domain nuclease of toxin-antitoxin system